jgi:sulfatase maturation enzyme AslB (radical SAM superfamily)
MNKRLEDIGFYTLSDERARTVTVHSDLQRCELIVTDRCNFKCPYCRGVKPEYRGSLSEEEARRVVGGWAMEGLHNIRFSGGEPTTWEPLERVVSFARYCGIGCIALSTNGSASTERYVRLIEFGVNDFSISLDACCSATADKMAGVSGKWERVVENIRALSKLTYVTVGVVVTDATVASVADTVRFAHELGVADIRVISAAQSPTLQMALEGIEPSILAAHPILRYRVGRAKVGQPMRGIGESDSNRCPLVLDDMATVGGHHFPCIIYLREGGKPIGRMGHARDVRLARERWCESHDTHLDAICRTNCLDVCVAHNNRVHEFE